MPAKISQNSMSQSDKQVVIAEADNPESSTSNLATSGIATAQIHLQSQIDVLNSDLVGLDERQKCGILTQEQCVKLKEK